jgi:hypothetical protein
MASENLPGKNHRTSLGEITLVHSSTLEVFSYTGHRYKTYRWTSGSWLNPGLPN